MDFPDFHEALVEKAHQRLDRIQDRVEGSVTPVYEASHEMGRTLVTLASSSLVLSIAVVQFLAGKLQHPIHGWLLPAAWILLGLTVVLGALRFSLLTNIKMFRGRMLKARNTVRQEVMGLDNNPGHLLKFDQIIARAVDEAADLPIQSSQAFAITGVAMFWSFTLGLGALLGFAIANLPF